MSAHIIIINKSTVPVGTGDWVADIVKNNQPKPIPFSVVSCPEFLREGTAIGDFNQPHRTVLGSFDREAAEKVAQLHLPLRAPIIITDLRTAEMIKYASNAFLATKISFINEIADICEALGADVKEVAIGMGYDKRIGSAMLDAGLGWGGSCFPKDVKALAYMAEEKQVEPRILNTVTHANYDRRQAVVNRVEEMLGTLQGKTIGLLGLAFKPNTDDMREAPSIDIAQKLVNGGAKVRAYDPVAAENARYFQLNDDGTAEPVMFMESYRRLIRFVDGVASLPEIDAGRIFLLGFSMGTIMMYALALTHPEKFAGVIAQSGFVRDHPELDFQWKCAEGLRLHHYARCE